MCAAWRGRASPNGRPDSTDSVSLISTSKSAGLLSGARTSEPAVRFGPSKRQKYAVALVQSTTIPNHCFVALAESRVIKSPDERKLLRYASWVSSNAHAEVMREARPGVMEYQLEARFLYHLDDDADSNTLSRF